MACLLVPLAEAVVVSAVRKFVVKSDSQNEKMVSLNEKLGDLNKMLYGGSFLLAVEHVYHGEIIFAPPFLTAMETAEETAVMLHEMSTVGVGMALLTTGLFAAIQLAKKLKKRSAQPASL